MKYTVQQIKAHPEDIMIINQEVDVTEELQQRHCEFEVVRAPHVEGYFAQDGNEIVLHGTIDVSLKVPSTRTLKPVEMRLNIPIRERYLLSDDIDNLEDYEETVIVLEEPEINLAEVVTDLIIINIPMKVYDDAEDDQHLPEGTDWQVVTEEQFVALQKAKQADTSQSPFAQLQHLFDDQE